MAIIDAQAHYMPPEVAQNTTFFKVHWSDLDKQLATMDRFGIEKAILLYPTSDAHLKMGGWANLCRAFNQGIAEAVKSYPGRFIGGGIVPVDGTAPMEDVLKEIKEQGLKVLSLASSYDGRYLDDEMFHCLFEFAQKTKMPIHVHPQIINPIGEERLRDPLLSPVLEYVFDVTVCLGRLMMEGTFLKFPDVKIIFAHYGGVLPIVKERFDNTYQMLRGRGFVKDLQKVPSEYFKNLFFDTSGSQSLGALLCALEVTDASHILWGSDYPANQNMEGAISVVEKSPLSGEQKKKILYDNASKILQSC